jgi:organic hydroperoxide reductase OsmC/OhrA
MPNKTDKQYQFEVQLTWAGKKRGILSAKDATGTIEVATPPEFGGEGFQWSPEHLLLSALNSCFMSTFLAFADKLKLTIERFDCPVIGQVGFVDSRLRFFAIDLYPKVQIADESLREKAVLALEKTHKYCIITNSVSTPVFYHSEISIERKPETSNSSIQ